MSAKTAWVVRKTETRQWISNVMVDESTDEYDVSTVENIEEAMTFTGIEEAASTLMNISFPIGLRHVLLDSSGHPIFSSLYSETYEFSSGKALQDHLVAGDHGIKLHLSGGVRQDTGGLKGKIGKVYFPEAIDSISEEPKLAWRIASFPDTTGDRVIVSPKGEFYIVNEFNGHWPLIQELLESHGVDV